MSKVGLVNNFFLIILANFAFFSFFAVEVYGINYSYETPASKILFSDKSYEIPLKVKNHKGLSSLDHVQIKMKINDYQNTTYTSIMWSQLDGEQLVTVDDNELVKDVTVSALSRGHLEYLFEFTPTKQIELRSISVDVLEQKPNDIKKLSEESLKKQNKKDQITQHGIGRNTSFFNSYKEGQQLIAEETFNMLVGNRDIQNEYFGKNHKEYFNIEHISRSEDIHLKNSILKEMLRSEEFFEKHYQVHHNFNE